jgi:hypothetical protein
MIGLTGPRSEPDLGSDAPIETPRLETREARDARDASDARGADASLEIVREAERLELVREKSLEIVRESLELVRETLEHEEEEAMAASEPVIALTPTRPSPVVHVTTLPTPEEISIPPVGDLAVEPIAEQFFSEGEIAATAGLHDDEEWDEVANKATRRSLPEVIQRRARFAKYVRWAVGGAAVVCLAALARTAITPAKHAALPTGGAAAALVATAPTTLVGSAPEPKAATAAVVAEPAKPAEPAAAPDKVDAPKVDVATAVAPASEPAAAAAAPAAVAAAGDKTALQEKNDARRALERGKLGDAIEAGERSVALDATDGEAWLLLGAAYQEKGNSAEARRCYTACVKEGKHGPVGECRAMLR